MNCEMVQLDLFYEAEKDPVLKELHYVRDLAKATKESSDKVRKGIYARHGELAKKYIELHQRLEIIERHICYPKQSQSSSHAFCDL